MSRTFASRLLRQALLVAGLVLLAVVFWGGVYLLLSSPRSDVEPSMPLVVAVPAPNPVPTPGPPPPPSFPRETPPAEKPIPEPAAPLEPVVYLERYEQPAFPPGLLLRELLRQGFLLAARESLGLTTRDATLREPPPDKLAADNRLHLNPRIHASNPTATTVERTIAGRYEPIWRFETYVFQNTESDYPRILETAEELSRTGFVRALQRAGFRGRASPSHKDLAVPDGVEKRLGEMTFWAQYGALRALHDAVRTDGESPQRTGAICRAYAHLGVLTEYEPAPAHKVFKARALLYGQRLVRADPESAWSYWHRAYAFALAGLHQAALDDLARAEKLHARAGLASGVPAWVALIEPLCRLDTKRLRDAARDPELGSPARLFAFLTAENDRNPRLTLESARLVLASEPECFRVREMTADISGLGNRSAATTDNLELFSRTLRQRLAEQRGLPAAVARLVKEEAPEPDLVRALLAGGPTTGAAEPSWALLGRLAQEARFVQVTQRLAFVRDSQGAATDALEQLRPLVADHPWAPFAESYGPDPWRDRGAFRAKLAGFDPGDINPRSGRLIVAVTQADPARGKALNERAYAVNEVCYHDTSIVLNRMPEETDASPMAERLLRACPYAPAARAELIARRWDLAAPHAARWENEAQQPVVLVALARQYSARKQFADAERCAARAVALSPDRKVYGVLADVHVAQGKGEQAVQVMERFLSEQEDLGLEHARVRVALARQFMFQNDWKRALPYAEDAAGTGAAWALECYGECLEGLEEWDKAEAVLKLVSTRYSTGSHLWYYWCVRTGKGDEAAARKLFEKVLPTDGGPNDANALLLLGSYHALNGKPAKAAEAFQGVFEQSRTDLFGMLAVVWYDRAGDPASRDRVLKRITDRSPYKPVAGLLRETLARGETAVPERDAVEAVVKSMPAEEGLLADYLIGCFLEQRGRAEDAVRHYTRFLDGIRTKNLLVPTLAAWQLRRLTTKKP